MSGIIRSEYLEIKKKAMAAAHDEQLTRLRVERLEQRQAQMEKMLGRSILRRLRWLCFGS